MSSRQAILQLQWRRPGRACMQHDGNCSPHPDPLPRLRRHDKSKRLTGERGNRLRRARWVLVLATSVALVCTPVAAEGTQVRIKDITTVEGERINQLTGMGLVTGLAGTGGR